MENRPADAAGSNKNAKVRGPYAKSAEVRARILDACIEEFSVSGFHGATMKDIALRAGISQTGLLHHFATKRDLLDAVLHARQEQNARVIREAPESNTLHAQMAVIRDNAARPALIQLHSMLSAEATAQTHPAHDHHLLRYERFRMRLTMVFTELRDTGRLKTEATPGQLASLYIAALDGLQIQWLYDPTSVDVEAGMRAFVQSVADIDV
ncbi:hypothetical protein ASC66_04330 [Leifsonia sp. Root4]|uniref:TetR/AcrR family transcriptional regulator n=1 Tax=Leifsonia sp. Root4 TaxID=1736525 RepID=UPI0006FCE227|nr:TetR/AcrR family transcriptional regulator [Leifsonia sp. Root4]KQW08166.1 hypothetical protein ASC66_04330 [Leifsonia sp. Root4]